MKKTNQAETLVSILIWISIISVISFSAVKMIQYDKEKSIDYNKINNIYILETNANNLLKRVNISNFNEKEIFYLYKTWSQILSYSWTNNEYLKYINENWDLVTNTWTYNWKIYTRTFSIDKKTSKNSIININIDEFKTN